MPNVGKSTLFNALSNAKAQAANFPFCTIEPNIGVITVPDERLIVLEKLVKPNKVVPTTVEIVDIAGLVKGASKGEGLGNQFLGNIRGTDAIIHVSPRLTGLNGIAMRRNWRCFSSAPSSFLPRLAIANTTKSSRKLSASPKRCRVLVICLSR